MPALSRRRAFVRSLERLRIGFSFFWILVWKENGEFEFRIEANGLRRCAEVNPKVRLAARA